jgi:multiple sugar transport system ATP-binding protein
MTQIALDHVDKVYRGGVMALDGLSLAVRDGEFMALLGPSGSGKSTALRSIAGLEEISHGTITIGRLVANYQPARDRDIALLSAAHALYPRMTVRQNLSFGLRLRGTPKAEISRRVARAARMLGLEPLLGRDPATLSPGHRQRVALGRAVVREPRALLMDEPLADLEPGLRATMRAVLGQLRERLGVTTVYATRDQAEAMALGDRVCVLRGGRAEQTGTPRQLLESPVNLFVAGAVGFPAMNFAEARLVRDDGPTVTFAGHALPIPAAVLEARPGLAGYLGRTVIIGIRPSQFDQAGADAGAARGCGAGVARVAGGRVSGGRARFPVTVTATAELGPETHAIFQVDAPPIDHAWFDGTGLDGNWLDGAGARNAEQDEAVSALAGGTSLWTARVAPGSALRAGQPLELVVDPGRLHFFDPVTGESIGRLAARHELAGSPLR